MVSWALPNLDCTALTSNLLCRQSQGQGKATQCKYKIGVSILGIGAAHARSAWHALCASEPVQPLQRTSGNHSKRVLVQCWGWNGGAVDMVGTLLAHRASAKTGPMGQWEVRGPGAPMDIATLGYPRMGCSGMAPVEGSSVSAGDRNGMLGFHRRRRWEARNSTTCAAKSAKGVWVQGNPVSRPRGCVTWWELISGGRRKTRGPRQPCAKSAGEVVLLS